MRRILVTGGGSGIGRAIARAFAAAGDHVTIAGRRADALRETDGGRGMVCRVADVTDEARIAGLFDAPYDVVIANAGAGQSARLGDISLADWNATLAVNLTGTFLTLREGLRGMGAGGRLIAVASTAALQGGAGMAAYCASKHGILGLVRSVAIEVAKKGITCNAVCPGFVDTPLVDQAVAGVSARLGVDADTAVAKLVARNPAARLITPEEVAAAVLFLASPGAAMVNGHALAVSGGEI
jgi:3-hydroxybutyrate dehydrogenase